METGRADEVSRFPLRGQLVSFKQGKFYAIQAQTNDKQMVFVEGSATTHAEKLKLIARKANKMRGGNYYEDDDYDEYGSSSSVKLSVNPFALKMWPADTKMQEIIDVMRSIRKECGSHVDPMSLKIVMVETAVSTYVPESPSDVETELRRYVLEKLSSEEQKLLKVEHWAVYNKLADRSMLPDDDEE